jgi:phenylalanine ammonia-lyase
MSNFAKAIHSDMMNSHSEPLSIDGTNITLSRFSRFVSGQSKAHVAMHLDDTFFDKSINTLNQSLASGRKIYGVNTLFGGMANQESSDAIALQKELILSHLSGVGNALPDEDIKGAMLLRANSLCHGVSGIRKEIVERYLLLANNHVLPLVHEFGSIGASGDLIPLSAMAAAVCGISDQSKLKVKGEYSNAITVLNKLGLTPFDLRPKEGLALINGTSVLTAIAANNCNKLSNLFALHVNIQTLIAEIMECDVNPFSDFIQRNRPHPGQIAVAKILRESLSQSTMIRKESQIEADLMNSDLIQDRYSIRCMPQYLGAIIEDLYAIEKTVQIEMNSATDNPLIDSQRQTHVHGGNFLGQHIGMAMDKQRVCVALLAKHNEAQLAMLVEPAFSRGLNPSLLDEQGEGLQVGVKPLQILSNSLTPLLEHKANPLCTHFPIHAEQFNQNLNSQGFGSAQLTRESITIYTKQVAVMCIVVAQAACQRAKQKNDEKKLRYSQRSKDLLQSIGTVINVDLFSASSPVESSSGGNYSAWLALLSTAIEHNKLPGANSIDWENIKLS